MISEERKKEINGYAKGLRKTLWINAGRPTNLSAILESFEIEKVISFKGYTIKEAEYIRGNSTGKAIGYLSKATKDIFILTDIINDKGRKNFTLAHELGHLILHPNMDVAHREVSRTIGKYRPKAEEEADYFASCFLMPENLVISEFNTRFISHPLVFSDNVIYHLTNDSLVKQELLEATNKSYLRELTLAKATSFNLKYFESLASFFKVSPDAMAIRLQELRLVIYP